MKLDITDTRIIIDEYFEKTVVDNMIKEVERVHPNMLSISKLHTAEGNQIDAQSKFVMLDTLYNKRRDNSIILTAFDAMWSDNEFRQTIESAPPQFRYLNYTIHDSSELQLYTDGDYFAPHPDYASEGEILPIDLFLCREPKKFTGGQLRIGDELIEFKNNRMVIFPAFHVHEVMKVSMESKDPIDGRMTIQHRATWYQPTKNMH